MAWRRSVAAGRVAPGEGVSVDLAGWRDVAAILLAVEWFVLNLVPLALYYFALRGVLALQKKLRPVLTRAQEVSRQADQGVDRGTRAVARPFIWLRSNAAGARRAWATYREGRGA